MKYKAVLFDLDGTLINTDLYVVCNYVHIFQKHNVELPTLKEMVYFSGPPLVEVFGKYLPDLDVNMLKKEFSNYALENLNRMSKVYDYEIEMLTSLKNNGVKLGLVTNKGKDSTFDCLKYFGLDKFFDSIYYLEKCEKCKPDAWPLINCSKDLGVNIKQCLYVGDDKYDLIASKNANIDSVLVKFGLKEGLEKYNPTYIIKSYKDLERIVYGRK